MKQEKIKNSFLSFFKLDIIQELFFSGLVCSIFFIIFDFFPEKFWDKDYRRTIIVIFGLSFFLIFLIFNQTNSRFKLFKINFKRNIILFSIFNYITWCFLFYTTPFGFLGIGADNYYRSAYITQMAHSGYPQDFIYKGRSAFYSPFYWYCLALISIIFQISPYKMVKIGFLLTYYILPIILFEFWKKIYDDKIAFIITVISFLIIGDIYSTDHMIGYMLFIPYFIYYFENFPKRDFKIKNYIIGGAFGAIIFCTYFLYFLIIPIYYLIVLIRKKSRFKEDIKHISYLTFFLIIFSSWFWFPLLIDILFIGFESHQNNYFSPTILTFPLLSYFQFSIFGLIFVIGAVYIIGKYSTNLDLKIFGNLLLSINIIFLFGFLGILIKFPIMHIRFLYVAYYILIISFCIFYIRFFHFLSTDFLIKKGIKMDLRLIKIYIIIGITFFQYTNYLISISNSAEYEGSIEEDYPADLIDIFEELDYEDKVFLTTKYRVAAFIPIYLFLLPNPYYSHPSSLYDERVKFLVELSECETPKAFHKKVVNNPFEPIDYFFLDLENNHTVLVFKVAVERFPDGRDYYEIKFDRILFQDPDLFKEIVIEGKIIYKTKY